MIMCALCDFILIICNAALHTSIEIRYLIHYLFSFYSIFLSYIVFIIQNVLHDIQWLSINHNFIEQFFIFGLMWFIIEHLILDILLCRTLWNKTCICKINREINVYVKVNDDIHCIGRKFAFKKFTLFLYMIQLVRYMKKHDFNQRFIKIENVYCSEIRIEC